MVWWLVHCCAGRHTKRHTLNENSISTIHSVHLAETIMWHFFHLMMLTVDVSFYHSSMFEVAAIRHYRSSIVISVVVVFVKAWDTIALNLLGGNTLWLCEEYEFITAYYRTVTNLATVLTCLKYCDVRQHLGGFLSCLASMWQQNTIFCA